MKKQILTAAIALGTFLCVMPFTSIARDNDDGDGQNGKWDSQHHYRVDNSGYWDEHHKHQKFIIYRKHRGYWDTQGDTRVFIRISS